MFALFILLLLLVLFFLKNYLNCYLATRLQKFVLRLTLGKSLAQLLSY